MPKRRRTSLKRLYADLKDAPPNVASLEVTEAGFKVEFRAGVTADRTANEPARDLAEASMGRGASPKLVPGTPFPDDDSPINVADLTLMPPDLDETN